MRSTSPAVEPKTCTPEELVVFNKKKEERAEFIKHMLKPDQKFLFFKTVGLAIDDDDNIKQIKR